MRPIQQLWLIPHEQSEKHPGALSWGAGDAEASRFKPSTCVKVLGLELCGYSGRGGAQVCDPEMPQGCSWGLPWGSHTRYGFHSFGARVVSLSLCRERGVHLGAVCRSHLTGGELYHLVDARLLDRVTGCTHSNPSACSLRPTTTKHLPRALANGVSCTGYQR
jgi:hypothetical protein